jgi:hypothetical protein
MTSNETPAYSASMTLNSPLMANEVEDSFKTLLSNVGLLLNCEQKLNLNALEMLLSYEDLILSL